MCFKGRWVRGMAAHRTALALLAIDIHLTAAAAGLVGSAASCCPGQGSEQPFLILIPNPDND